MRALTNEVGNGAGSRTPTLLLAELKAHCESDEQVQSGQPFYANVHCDISIVFTNADNLDRQCFYLACPACRKKVIDDGQGYRCENCNRSHEDAVPTYNFAFKVQDCTGEMTV